MGQGCRKDLEQMVLCMRQRESRVILTRVLLTCSWPCLFCREMTRLQDLRGSLSLGCLNHIKTLILEPSFLLNDFIFSDYGFLFGFCFEDLFSFWFLVWLCTVEETVRNVSTRQILGSNFVKMFELYVLLFPFLEKIHFRCTPHRNLNVQSTIIISNIKMSFS